jgi:thiamine-phosphate pyrophosphorylase
MPAPYDMPPALKSLMTIATQLRAERAPCRLAPLVLMHDRNRTPDIENLATRLPEGSALIYREAEGQHDLARADRLRMITQDRGVQFLIGGDPAFASVIKADGVHLPRGRYKAKDLRRFRKDWIITQAAPKTDRPFPAAGLDAVFVSSVFDSASPSAGAAIGVEELTNRTAATPCPVIALGGITTETAPTLIGTGVSGLAAIDGLAELLRPKT